MIHAAVPGNVTLVVKRWKPRRCWRIGGVQILVARCVMQGVCGRIFPRASIFTAEVVITRIDANVEIPDCGSARMAPFAVLIA